MTELKREEIGNLSKEVNADVEGIASAELPPSRPEPIEVSAELLSDGLALTPKWNDESLRALGDLKEGPLDIAMAQMVEDPDMTGLETRQINGIEVIGKSDRLGRIALRSHREGLVWYGMHPEYYGAVAGDRIMLRRDLLESSYSCKECKGQGYEEDTPCPYCEGSRRGSDESPCNGCIVLGFGRETNFSSGHKKCAKCFGSGWRNGVVIPEESQSQAITGVVVSVGPEVTRWKIGDRLMFSRYAGHTLEVSKQESFIMMGEKEAIGILRQRQ